jgi:hypothetical protein
MHDRTISRCVNAVHTSPAAHHVIAFIGTVPIVRARDRVRCQGGQGGRGEGQTHTDRPRRTSRRARPGHRGHGAGERIARGNTHTPGGTPRGRKTSQGTMAHQGKEDQPGEGRPGKPWHTRGRKPRGRKTRGRKPRGRKTRGRKTSQGKEDEGKQRTQRRVPAPCAMVPWAGVASGLHGDCMGIARRRMASHGDCMEAPIDRQGWSANDLPRRRGGSFIGRALPSCQARSDGGGAFGGPWEAAPHHPLALLYTARAHVRNNRARGVLRRGLWRVGRGTRDAGRTC